ncbi:Bug family tripartite tricarboxylate transporter substrate binding protein [Alicycliphilus sp. T452]
MQRKDFLKLAVLSITTPLVHQYSLAQTNYPNKPITMVVGFAPGGMTDIVGRLLAAELGKGLKQSVIVENKPGAAGQLATEYVARKSPDGYTLQLSAAGHVIAPATQKTVRYDPVKDFEAIAMVANAPIVLVVHPQLPVQSVAEFINWAKSQPTVPYGSAGVGGSSHLAGELFRHVTGTPLTHVAYRGGAPAISDLVAGQINVAFMDSVSVASFIRAGKIKLLAVAAKSRSNLFPDTPTITEAGYKDVDTSSWLGLYAPAGTAVKDVSLLNQQVNRVMNSLEVIERLKQQNCEPGTQFNLDQMRKFVAEETAKWKNIVRITGVRIE